MECREAERFIDLRIDGEIEPSDGDQLDAHVAACPACHREFHVKAAYQGRVRAALAAAETTEPAPSGLRARVRAQAAEAERPQGFFGWGRAVSVSLGVAMVAVLSWGGASGPPLIPDEAVLRHSVNLPPEVRADPDDVRPVQRFLSKNLRYPVAVPRFTRGNAEVRLVGARLSSLDQRDAAYVMYDHRGAKISLFAFPKPARFTRPESFREVRAGGRDVLVGQRRGYNLVAWEEGEVVYSLVSDIDPRELIELAATSR